MKQPKLSVIVLTKNEADTIQDCLKSAEWADEIIVVDDFSHDQTIALAQQFGQVKVIKNKLKDFASQLNFSIKQAAGEWLFFLDADERISIELAQQIKTAIRQPHDYAAFQINRANIFLGRQMKFGGWSPDRPARLFKTVKLKGWRGAIHESSVVDGKVGLLDGRLWHFSHRGLSSMLTKTIAWSEMEAQLRLKVDHPPVTWWRVLRVGATDFFERLISKQGWRDGMVGWIEIIYQSISLMITYLRLWEMQL